MSDTFMHYTFWSAFGGLVISMLGFVALFQSECQRGRLALRLTRANGTGPARRAKPEAVRGSSLAHARMQLRNIVLLVGERLSVVLGSQRKGRAFAGHHDPAANFCVMPAVFVEFIGPAALSVFDNIISRG